MSVDVKRLKLAAETEKELTKSIAIMDYEETKRVLESVNNAVISGVEVDCIVSMLNILVYGQRINLKS